MNNHKIVENYRLPRLDYDKVCMQIGDKLKLPIM